MLNMRRKNNRISGSDASDCVMRACGTFLLWATMAVASPAQTFTTLADFNGIDGSGPELGSLVQGTDGNFYGTTLGGVNTSCTLGCGTIFKVTPGGTLTSLYSFCAQTNCADGFWPISGLVLGTDGNFYGTTEWGGVTTGGYGGYGTVFKITPTGALTTLHTFDFTDGSQPIGGLVEGTDGNFYGTTYEGGANLNCTGGCGTVFRITPSGTLTTLHSFDSTDGAWPYSSLVQATNGLFYGTTIFYGAVCCGTVFSISSAGTLTTLHNFGSTDGDWPYGLIQGTDGNFYGVTYEGGSSTACNQGCGTVFKMTPEGTLTTLVSFDITNGSKPSDTLVQATNGAFYGTTFAGGAHIDGTIFKITSAGKLTTLYSFCAKSSCTDGSNPTGGLVQATSGTLYGTTSGGGSGGNGQEGTVFSEAVGLGAFVETLPTSGKVGTAVDILGTNLIGATSVTFNGTAATFAVVSSTLITTTVPAGAKTGKVEVVTPSGTLSSKAPFRVK